jgi:predicted DNA-binding antitoxin AbrB/MazE fold protein
MTQHVNAIYENGVLRPLGPLDLQDRDVVSLSVHKVDGNGAQSTQSEPSLFDVLDAAGLVGCITDAPADLSTNRKYLEGFGKSGKHRRSD